MPRLFALAALLVSASACDSGEPGFTDLQELTGGQNLLVGTWQWERSYGCGDGSTPCRETTPLSTGRTETLTFTGGTVVGFFNGSQVGPTTYRVDVAVGDGVDRSYVSRFIALGERGSGYGTQFGVSRDRLVISSAAVDGEETTYRRAR